MSPSIQHLLSLPPAMAAWFSRQPRAADGTWFASCDPAGRKLGSGGGIAQLLADAWRADGCLDFSSWLEARKRLVLLAGGQSRRLPSYAATGKIFMPVPVMRWGTGQRLDQTLLDLQARDYGRVLERAPSSSRVLVTSGDVFLSFPSEWPEIPEADVVGFGMAVSPEVAKDFGVFFSARETPGMLSFFLQKPDAGRIRELARGHSFFVDTGLWLLSARAVNFLLRRCGWDGNGFAGGTASGYELYAGMGPGLGAKPAEPDPELSALTAAVVPLRGAEFHHFGTTRQMIESLSALQNRRSDDPTQSDFWRKPHPDMYVLNSDFAFETRTAGHSLLWIENCALPPRFELPGENALTGLPPGEWAFELPRGVCLDVVPVGESSWVVRPYGFDDPFSGPLEAALWMGRPAGEWFEERGISLEAAGLDPGGDIQEAAIFAVVDSMDSGWISWLIHPGLDENRRKQWLAARRVSARELGEIIHLDRLFAQRRTLSAQAVGNFWSHRGTNPFFRVDLENAAALYAASPHALPAPDSESALDRVYEAAFAAAVARARGLPGDALEREAFSRLAEQVISRSSARPVVPRSTLIEDQILWARSPVRLDLAGGWSDTPPFCLKHGGAVVNMAVDLNGQAPVQVFVRLTTEKRLVIRSIDLGAETVVSSFDELENYAVVGAEFSLAKAAFCLAGFHPRFRGDGAPDLAAVLEEFGGGLEVSLLAATPKGSGLGTSSVLAATLLAALGSAGGLAWDRAEIFQRTLALEQMLTTGGGWQDQAGGIYHGIKLIETGPGLLQTPSLRWLPEDLFGADVANHSALLYYTGLTRVAKTILGEIVRGMFLNAADRFENLFAIREHARAAYQAIQRESWDDLCRVVARSAELNQALDAGTHPPDVVAMLNRVADWTAGAKLLGAGGGGYVLFLAKDPQAALRIRETLTAAPPNPRARFVDFAVSRTGLQITRS